MAVLNPDHLLDQAARLLTAPGGVGAPRQADLRRAISTAYYGLFHAIVTHLADDFGGKTKRNTLRYELLYRSIDHRALKRICNDITKRTLPERYLRYLPPGGFGTDIEAVATAIVDLQEKRHQADYDPRFRVSASDASLAIKTAQTALQRLRSASRARQKAFNNLLLFSPERAR